jgi:glycerophosphoryl diester phosphodiesterase
MISVPTSICPLPLRILRKVRIPLLFLAGLLVLYLSLVLVGGGWRPRLDDTFAWEGDTVLLFAHRGVCVSVPENSEASLSEALRLGFQAVEIDVRKTRDNELVLFHDPTATKMLGLKGALSDWTLEQVRGCKLLFAGQETTNSVPTLREIFQKYGHRLRFYLDMKNRGLRDADRIVALIDEFQLHDRTILASVNPLFVAYVEHHYPKVNTALERFDYFQVWLYRLTPSRWKPDFPSGLARKVTPGHIEWLRREKLLSRRIAYEADGPDYVRILNHGITKAVVDYDPAVHSQILSRTVQPDAARQ